MSAAAFDWHPLVLSLQVATLATVLALIAGIALGWLFARHRFAGSSVLEAVCMLPLVLPPTVIGYGILVAMGRRSPLGAWLREHFDYTIIFNWHGAVARVGAGGVAAGAQVGERRLRHVDRTLEAAARTLRQSRWSVFLRVTLPLAWPGILAGTLLAFARAMGEFGASLMVAGSIRSRRRRCRWRSTTPCRRARTTMRSCSSLITSVLSIVILVASNRYLRLALTEIVRHETPASPCPARRRDWPCPLSAAAQQLTVSAAASLTDAFKEIGQRFEAAKPGVTVRFNFAASGVLIQQITQGAPVDVFASADQETMNRGVEQKLIDAASRRDFAANALVLIVPAQNAPPVAKAGRPRRAGGQAHRNRQAGHRAGGPLHAAGARGRRAVGAAGAEARAGRQRAPGARLRGARRSRGRLRVPHRCGLMADKVRIVQTVEGHAPVALSGGGGGRQPAQGTGARVRRLSRDAGSAGRCWRASASPP